SIYRRGARRWRKLYRINGHIFQAKRFNRKAFCAFCHDRIWGLGRQGFKCIQCKLLVHKKCHKLGNKPCSNEHVEPVFKERDHHDPNDESSTGDVIQAPLDYPSELHSGDGCDQVPVEVNDNVEEPLEPVTQRQYSLNDFELIRVIGRGSYAKVLMVELKKTRRIYAMKVIKKALVTDDEDIDWVQTEKHVFETASNHPFLVGLHSCFQTPSRLFFVIEFVRGFSVDWWALGVLLYEMLAGRSPFDIAGASENPDQNTEDYLFQVILEKTIRIPRSLSVKAASVLKGFLNKNPADRLGCNRDSAFLDIMNHSFFKSIDWEMLAQKEVTPPYIPSFDGCDQDITCHFDPQFTREPAELTPDDPRVIDKIDQTEFEGFEYVNPLLMSLEDCV
uniref:protein kinase C n=1 Tax=Anopheles epiroticus TaxID=199890 RepID=A0A182P1B1_9DIPT